MKSAGKTRALVAAASALVVLAGCHEYEARVEIRPDGSGTRTVIFSPELDEALSEAEMHRIFVVSPDEGWVRVEDEQGKARFRRTVTSATPDGWAALGGDVRLFSRTDDRDGRKGPAGLRNDVSLETGRIDGGRTFTYRERLRWDGLKRDLIDLMAGVYERCVVAAWPGLPDVFVAELRGLYRGHLTQTWERVPLSDQKDDFLDILVSAMTPDVEELVSRRNAAVDPVELVDLGVAVIEDEDSQVEGIIERDLMGVAQAFVSSLKLSVEMPGEIIDTNGTVDDEGAVAWTVGLLEPMDKHVELVVRSLVRD
ncbi:hypothetical protein KKG45_04100 [bacterium]|nr:hypothetical protein [bacterium]MBU1072411.1 hypothetical protein [bacterium]MBU1674767.1 hypothetical protein [bacterium]